MIPRLKSSVYLGNILQIDISILPREIIEWTQHSMLVVRTLAITFWVSE